MTMIKAIEKVELMLLRFRIDGNRWLKIGDRLRTGQDRRALEGGGLNPVPQLPWPVDHAGRRVLHHHKRRQVFIECAQPVRHQLPSEGRPAKIEPVFI